MLIVGIVRCENEVNRVNYEGRLVRWELVLFLQLLSLLNCHSHWRTDWMFSFGIETRSPPCRLPRIPFWISGHVHSEVLDFSFPALIGLLFLLFDLIILSIYYRIIWTLRLFIDKYGVGFECFRVDNLRFDLQRQAFLFWGVKAFPLLIDKIA